MSVLPQIYTSNKLYKPPSKQGGIFSLSLLNNTAPLRNSLNQSFTYIDKNATRRTNKINMNGTSDSFNSNNDKSKFRISQSLNTINRRKIRSKSNFVQLLKKTSDQSPKSRSVISDHLSYIQNLEQADSTNTLMVTCNQSSIFIKAILKQDNQQLKQIENQMQIYKTTMINTIYNQEQQFLQQIEIFKKTISQHRRQTLMEAKINSRQTGDLVQQYGMIKQLMALNQTKSKKLQQQWK